MGTAVQAKRRSVIPGLGSRIRGEASRRGKIAGLLISLFSCLTVLTISSLGQSTTSLADQIRSGNAEQKRDALHRIRNIRTDEASRIAIPALTDKSEIVRATAASAVVFLPEQEAHNLLIPLLSDKSAFVRKEVAYAIGAVGDPRTPLGDDGEDRIASALRLALQRDKDPEVRAAAAVAMGTAGGLKSVWYLYFYLQESRPSENEEFVRRSAVRSIGAVAESIRSGSREVASVRKAIDREKLRRMDLSRELRAFGSASRLIVEILQNRNETDDVRREAAQAIGSIGDVSAVPVLTANLNAKDPYLASISKEALAKIKALE
jgi:HEAT repeat protein